MSRTPIDNLSAYQLVKTLSHPLYSRLGARSVQRRIDAIHHPSKRLFIHEFAQCPQFIFSLLLRPRLCDPFPPCPDLWPQNGFGELLYGDTEEVADPLSDGLGFGGEECLVGAVAGEDEVADV